VDRIFDVACIGCLHSFLQYIFIDDSLTTVKFRWEILNCMTLDIFPILCVFFKLLFCTIAEYNYYIT